jgi:nucleoside-diphosphate-sugar epimerase
MKILFTGHRGFLGRELIPHLQKNHEVTYAEANYAGIRDVEFFFRNRSFDFIIHSAIRGGRRVRADIADDFYNNMVMFENLASQNIPMITFCSGAAYGRQEDIYNVNENDIGSKIPEDYYGFAKYLISKRCSQLNHVYNLRFFNVFGPTTPNDMFTAVNIKNYIHKREIVIFKDKYMDFFGINDTKKVVDLYLNEEKNLPKEIDLVYPENKKLSDVAEMINNLSEYKVPVTILEKGVDKSYCSSGLTLKGLGIKLNGLEKELRNCYDEYTK